MKVCLAALLAFAIGVALPTFAQQTNTPDPKLRQRLIAVIQKHNDAINSNDAAALAALYTEDAVIVEQEGPTFGRKAIGQTGSRKYILATLSTQSTRIPLTL